MDVVGEIELVDGVAVGDDVCDDVGDDSDVDGVDVEVGEVVEPVEAVVVVGVDEGESVGGLVVVAVVGEGAVVEPEVGEVCAVVGLDVTRGGLVVEETLELGVPAVGAAVLGRTPGVVHEGGAMGDPPKPVKEPATLSKLTWTWSMWFWVGLPRSSIRRQPSAGRSTFQMCCCQMM